MIVSFGDQRHEWNMIKRKAKRFLHGELICTA